MTGGSEHILRRTETEDKRKSVMLHNMLEGWSKSKPHMEITEILHSREVELQAKEISTIINMQRSQRGEKPLNRGSVRVYLRQLFQKGYILEPKRGFYIAKDKLKHPEDVTNQDRMGSVKVESELLPRVHNVRLVFRGVRKRLLVSRGSWKRRLGAARVTFTEAGGDAVTVSVDCDDGYSMDWYGWGHVEGAVLEELGVFDKTQVRVPSAEFNRDYEGLRLDGMQAVTLYAFDGTFERYYNKRKSLRHEFKVSNVKNLQTLDILMKSGVTAYNVSQVQFAMAQNVRELVDALKGTNRLGAQDREHNRLVFEGFFQRFDRLVEALGHLPVLEQKVEAVAQRLDLLGKKIGTPEARREQKE